MIDFFGYKNCISLHHHSIRMIINPDCGGRILDLSVNKENIVYLDKTQKGWSLSQNNYSNFDPCGMRFDIGPEKIISAHQSLWLGKWTIDRRRNDYLKIISPIDSTLNLQITREIWLKTNPIIHFKIKTTATSHSTDNIFFNFWGRYLLKPDGTVCVPYNDSSRFPQQYIQYDYDDNIIFKTKDNHILVKKPNIFVKPTPKLPKIGFDLDRGIIHYKTKSNILFSCHYKTNRLKPNPEISNMNACIYYLKDKFCEIEPISYYKLLAPKSSTVNEELWCIRAFESNCQYNEIIDF